MRGRQYNLYLSTALLILVLAAWLRFYHLSHQSLWSDEGNSAALIRHDLIEIARRTAFDIHPPLYYWLLKGWVALFGDSELGLRSLSAVLGVGVVYLIGVLGSHLFKTRVGLTAAFIAALSPLQVYYAQEARMYMLLTFLSSLTVCMALLVFQNYLAPPKNIPAGFIYVLTATAGLYTHYAYPLILLLVNLVGFFWFLKSKIQNPKPKIVNWLILQFIPLLLYLPWLPIAWRQVTTWPSERESSSLLAILETIATTLLFGLSGPFKLSLIAPVGLGVAFLITLFPFCSRTRYHVLQITPHFNLALPLLWLWFLLPVGLTTYLFTPAFLKFLLVATPALALLLALAIEQLISMPGRRTKSNSPNGDRRRPATFHILPFTSSLNWPGYVVGSALLAALSGDSAISLYHYYTDASYARDDYRGIANFIEAVGGPQDAIILNAEGQQDVFSYYYQSNDPQAAPLYPLPRRRPLDEAATLTELQQIAAHAEKVYAVYWASRQADPQGLIENWLDTHLFKATDQWYGNVRLVSYATPKASSEPVTTLIDYQVGSDIRLSSYRLASDQAAPGDILQVTLIWETALPLAENYTVFAQVLDEANHVVGQRDAMPLTPTSDWPVAEEVIDTLGIFIEPGTPAGPHRLIVGLYDSQTGQRLPVISPSNRENQAGDFVELGRINITRPAAPLPLAAFEIQNLVNTPLLDIILLGYDLYKPGHRAAPDTPLQPGDPVRLVAYWMPSHPIRSLNYELSIEVVTNKGEATPIAMSYPLAGTNYPLKAWREGEIIRAQYDFFLNNLEPGSYRVALILNLEEGVAQTLTRSFQIR